MLSRVAEGEEADLIVVGRRGRGGVAELVLGSVTHELVLQSKRPVLVIEESATSKGAKGPTRKSSRLKR